MAERTAATLVVSRAPSGDAEGRRFDDALLSALQQSASGLRVLVVPHIYNLLPDDAAARRLAETGEPMVIGARLYPRATKWVLSALGCAVVGEISALDLRACESPEACAALLAETAGAAGPPGSQVTIEELDAPPRTRWYPVLDFDRCRNCKQCLDFCLFGVYSSDDRGQVRAVQPDKCKPGCPACARVCPAGAIMFPHFDAEPKIAGCDDAPDEAAPPAADPGGQQAAPTAGDELDDLIDALDELDES